MWVVSLVSLPTVIAPINLTLVCSGSTGRSHGVVLEEMRHCILE